jgi:GrpB-like predicted nucleotidyltransferase (UPF0157 family)
MPQKQAHHLRTGQAIIIAARQTPMFRTGKRLREAVQPASPGGIMPYDPAWPLIFAGLKDVYASTLGRLALAIEHVGSTAAPGLAAKPIIDVDVVIPARAVLSEVIRRLATLGYRHQGDLGVPGREASTRNRRWHPRTAGPARSHGGRPRAPAGRRGPSTWWRPGRIPP